MKKQLKTLLSILFIFSIAANIVVLGITNNDDAQNIINAIPVLDIENKETNTIWNGIGQPYWTYYSAEWSDIEYLIPMPTIKNGSNAIGFNKSLVANSENIYGRESTEVKKNIAYTIFPNIPLSSAKMNAMMYMNIPKVSWDNAPSWASASNISIKTIYVLQDGNEFSVKLDESIKFSAFSLKNKKWEVLQGTELKDIKDGFEGYIALDFNTVSWNGSAPDMNKEFLFNEISFELFTMGGSAGKFSVEGFYAVDRIGDSRLIKIGDQDPIDLIKEKVNPISAKAFTEINSKEENMIWNGVAQPYWSYYASEWEGIEKQIPMPTVKKGSNAVGFENKVSANSDKIYGRESTEQKKNIAYTVFPNITLTSDKRIALIYFNLPKLSKDNAPSWANESNIDLKEINVTQGEEEFKIKLDENIRFDALSARTKKWEVLQGAELKGIKDGFEGYIALDFNTVSWNGPAPDLTKEFILKDFSFELFTLGGAAGHFSVEGFYAVDKTNGMMSINLGDGIEREMLNSGEGSYNLNGEDDPCDYEGPAEAKLIEGFENIKPGDVLTGSKVVCEDEGIAEGYKNRGAIGAANSIKLNYEKVKGFGKLGSDQGFKLKYDSPISLKNATHIIFYVSLPVSKEDNKGNNWVHTDISIVNDFGGKLSRLKNNAEIKTLSKNGNKWISVYTENGTIQLPTAFEGYIKIKLNNFTAIKDGFENNLLEQSVFQFSTVGGDYGAAYINAVYAVTKNSDKITVKLNNGEEAFYTSGKYVSSLSKEQTNLINGAMKGTVLKDFTNYPLGLDLYKICEFSCDRKSDVLAKTAEGFGGIFEGPVLEISSPTLGGFHDTDPYYNIKYPLNTYIDDIKAVIFYIKCAKPHPQKPGCSSFRFNIASRDNKGKWTWSLLGEGSAQYMTKNGDKWITPEGDEYGIITLPENFEGYVMVEIPEFKQNPIADNMDGRYLVHSTLQFQAVGGEAGNAYIGGIYGITDLTNKNRKLITFNNCDVYNLSTNKYADVKDAVTDGPSKDIQYENIPKASLDKQVQVSEVTNNSFKAAWEAIPNVYGYRVDVYYTVNKENGYELRYMCKISEKTRNNSIELTGLDSGVRYHVVVTCINENGNEGQIYKFNRFTTNRHEKMPQRGKLDLLNNIVITDEYGNPIIEYTDENKADSELDENKPDNNAKKDTVKKKKLRRKHVVVKKIQDSDDFPVIPVVAVSIITVLVVGSVIAIIVIKKTHSNVKR